MTIRLPLILLFLGFMALLMTSCTPVDNTNIPADDVLLAEVYNRKLYQKDLAGLATLTDKSDSIAITKAFVDRWVKEQVLLHEAELNIPPDLEINKLVRNYRSSLIVNNYKQRLITSQLDSTITFEELRTYYNETKEQYHLSSDIVQLRLVRLPKPVDDINSFRDLWNNKDSTSLVPLAEYCEKMEYDFLLQDSVWHDLSDIISTIPNSQMSLASVKYKKNYDFQDSDFRYFIWIIDHKETQEIAPLRYIQEQARRVLMHRKQQDLINKINDDLFEKAIQEKNITIYQ